MGRIERYFWVHEGESGILKNVVARFISVTLKCELGVACGAVKRWLKLLISNIRMCNLEFIVLAQASLLRSLLKGLAAPSLEVFRGV